jgi:hypothetical protein
MSTSPSHQFDEALRVADGVSHRNVQKQVEQSLQDSLSEEEKIHVYDLYEQNEIDPETAETLLGEEEFRILEENSEGTAGLLNGDSSRFLA